MSRFLFSILILIIFFSVSVPVFAKTVAECNADYDTCLEQPNHNETTCYNAQVECLKTATTPKTTVDDVPPATSGIWAGTNCNVSEAKRPCDLCDASIVGINIVNTLLKIAIPIAVGMIVAGAIVLMVSAGNESKVETGRSMITNAVIGLIIAMCTWVIVNTVIHVLADEGQFNIKIWDRPTCGQKFVKSQ